MAMKNEEQEWNKLFGGEGETVKEDEEKVSFFMIKNYVFISLIRDSIFFIRNNSKTLDTNMKNEWSQKPRTRSYRLSRKRSLFPMVCLFSFQNLETEFCICIRFVLLWSRSYGRVLWVMEQETALVATDQTLSVLKLVEFTNFTSF